VDHGPGLVAGPGSEAGPLGEGVGHDLDQGAERVVCHSKCPRCEAVMMVPIPEARAVDEPEPEGRDRRARIFGLPEPWSTIVGIVATTILTLVALYWVANVRGCIVF
jgi:hypothetical protein